MFATLIFGRLPQFNFVAIAAFCSLLLPNMTSAQVPEVDRIRYVLATRCASCHNATDKKGGFDLTTEDAFRAGGESGPGLVASDWRTGILWKKLDDREMPPNEELPADEHVLLAKWFEQGAIWQWKRIDPLEFSSSQRAGYDWWALQPLAKRYYDFGDAHPVDYFIARGLQDHDLVASPAADRRTLIRRISYDLLGIPPTKDQVARFQSDESDKAYDSLIDSMLDSSAYGQRWARHWLDVVRFGESQGFERDRLRTNAWRYRDWVVDAFNSDMPYDQFCRLQIAGDVLFPNSPEANIATGFLTAGPYDEVGQKQQSAAMRAVVRQDELEDLVSAIGQTFLGLTINCCRCHDHKFDPISQKEYYQIAAALAGVQHGQPKVSQQYVRTSGQSHLERVDARIAQLESEIASIEKIAKATISRHQPAPSGETMEAPRPIASWEFNDELDSLGELRMVVQYPAAIHGGKLHLSGLGFAHTPFLDRELEEKTLEAWVQLSDLDQQGGAAISVESKDGAIFDAIVFGERELGKWTAGSNGFLRTESFQADTTETAQNRPVHIAIAYHQDGTIAAYRDGLPYGNSYRSSSLQKFAQREARVLFGLRHSPAREGRVLQGTIERARLYDRALNAEEVAASVGAAATIISEAEIEASLPLPDRQLYRDRHFELAQLREHRARILDEKIYAVEAKPPAPTFVLDRGNPGSPNEEVEAGGIASIQGVDSNFQVELGASDSERRRAFVNWIANQENPLFARVIVNRIWHYHFGRGIVDTPNDFGFNGGRPSHPELLDWLAQDLIEHRWSLKHLHRRILSSRTYQQSSSSRPEALKVDSENRWLWRKSPVRLDAESLRDTMLSLAGQLDLSLGGPGFYEFTTYTHNSQFYEPREAMGDTFYRRTLYRTWVRSARNNLLDVFDCPDPSTKTPQRAVTTTPLQSLALLHNASIFRIADAWAELAKKDGRETPQQQIEYLYQTAFHRLPSSFETDDCQAYVAKYGMTALCRVLLNCNELLYLD